MGVAECLGDFLGLREDLVELCADAGLGRTGDLGQLVHEHGGLAGERRHIGLDMAEQGGDHALVLGEQNQQQVLGSNLRIALLTGECLSVGDGLSGLDGEPVEFHGVSNICGVDAPAVRASGAPVYAPNIDPGTPPGSSAADACAQTG
jgi:hypothetical protein